MNGPQIALAACRFLHNAATMLLWGTFAYLATLVPQDLAQAMARRMDGFRRGAVAVAILTTAARLPIAGAVIGDGWSNAIDPGTLRAVLFDTSVGWAWQAEGFAALLVVATLAVPVASRLGATALASGVLLTTLALTGHAVMQDGWQGVAHRTNDAVHLLAAGAWVGALLPLRPILQALDHQVLRGSAITALRRFSRAGHVAVAVTVATGIANTGFILGRWPLDWTSGYQAMLAGKIAIVAVLIALALGNRYLLVPRMSQGRVAVALRRSTVTAVVLGLAAIACVSVLGLLDPD